MTIEKEWHNHFGDGHTPLGWLLGEVGGLPGVSQHYCSGTVYPQQYRGGAKIYLTEPVNASSRGDGSLAEAGPALQLCWNPNRFQLSPLSTCSGSERVKSLIPIRLLMQLFVTILHPHLITLHLTPSLEEATCLLSKRKEKALNHDVQFIMPRCVKSLHKDSPDAEMSFHTYFQPSAKPR